MRRCVGTGMFFKLRSEATICDDVEFVGVGVHNGLETEMKISPANEGNGIVFKRTDIKDKYATIRLEPNAVVDPILCTRIVNRDGVSIAVVEHLLAAFRICGITNAIVEVNTDEIPIMDGSALEFVKAFKHVGISCQDAYVPAIVIAEPISISYKSANITISPSEECQVSLKLSYDRINPVIGANNAYSFSLSDNLTNMASARTFGWVVDYEKVRAMGLAKGASEENTIAISDGNTILNEGGLRNPKELIMHKCLDLLGDISVIGSDIIGKIEGINTSHVANNMLMRKLMGELHKHEVIYPEKSSSSFWCLHSNMREAAKAF